MADDKMAGVTVSGLKKNLRSDARFWDGRVSLTVSRDGVKRAGRQLINPGASSPASSSLAVVTLLGREVADSTQPGMSRLMSKMHTLARDLT
jgi:hypothetical protein